MPGDRVIEIVKSLYFDGNDGGDGGDKKVWGIIVWSYSAQPLYWQYTVLSSGSWLNAKCHN